MLEIDMSEVLTIVSTLMIISFNIFGVVCLYFIIPNTDYSDHLIINTPFIDFIACAIIMVVVSVLTHVITTSDIFFLPILMKLSASIFNLFNHIFN